MKDLGYVVDGFYIYTGYVFVKVSIASWRNYLELIEAQYDGIRKEVKLWPCKNCLSGSIRLYFYDNLLSRDVELGFEAIKPFKSEDGVRLVLKDPPDPEELADLPFASSGPDPDNDAADFLDAGLSLEPDE